MGLLDQVLGGALGGSSGGQASPTSPLVKALLVLLAAKAVQHYNQPRPGGQGGAQPMPQGAPGQGGFGSGGVFGGTPGFPGGGQAGNAGGYGGAPRGGQSGGMGGLSDMLGGLLGGRGGGGMLGGGGGGLGGGGSRGGGLGGMLGGGGAGGGALGGLGGGMLGGLLASGLGSLLQGMHQRGMGAVADSWVGTGQNQSIDPSQLADALGPDTLSQLSQETGMSQDDLLPQLSQALPGFVDGLTPNGRLPTEDEANDWV